jgi:phosphatidate cytidylyltransferase
MNPLLLQVSFIIGAATVAGSILNILTGIIRQPDSLQYKQSWLKLAIMLGLVFGMLVTSAWGKWSFLPFVLILAYFGWQEVLQAVEQKYGAIVLPNVIWVLGAVGTLGGLMGGSNILMAIVVTTWMAVILPLIFTRSPIPLHSLLVIPFGMCFISAPLSYLLDLSASYGLFAFLTIVSMTNDGFSEGVGRFVGTTKICPEISPGKTWEGALGGLIAAMAIGYGLKFLVPNWQIEYLLMVVAGISISLLIGDLVFSAIKREIGIKDFGTTLGVTGGVLDKFDGLMFAIPMFCLMTQAVGV